MPKGGDQPAKRGEAKWKEVREAVAQRNEEARRTRGIERAAFERTCVEARRAAERARRGKR